MLKNIYLIVVFVKSEEIPEGLYLIEAVHSGKFITFSPDRSTLVQQDQNTEVSEEDRVFFFCKRIFLFHLE